LPVPCTTRTWAIALSVWLVHVGPARAQPEAVTSKPGETAPPASGTTTGEGQPPVQRPRNANTAEARIHAGDAHWRAGEFPEAAREYEAAWLALDPGMQRSALGELLVLKATDAYRLAREANAEETLRASEILLQRYIDSATEAGLHPNDALVQEHARIRAELDAIEPEPEPEPAQSLAADPKPEASPLAEPDPEPGPITPPPTRDDRAPSERPSARRQASFALFAVGAAATITGAVLVGTGARLTDDYLEEQRDARFSMDGYMNLPPSDQAAYAETYDAWIADAEDTRRLRIGIGIAALGVGVASLVVGAVLFAKDKPSASVRARVERRWTGGRVRF